MKAFSTVKPLELTEADAKALGLALMGAAPAPNERLKNIMKRARERFGACLLLCLLLASCKGSQVATQEPAAPAHQHTVSHTPDTGTPPAPGLPLYQQQVEQANHLPAAPPKLPANPTRREYKAYKRQLDAWQKAQEAYAKASRAPLITGKGSVYAPQATEVQNAYKPAAPVVKADTGSTVYAAASKAGPAVAGNDNETTSKQANPLGTLLAVAVVAVLVGAGIWLLTILPWRKKETETTA